MRIGIDISQIAYEKTGVSNFLYDLVENLLEVDNDNENEYVLFFSSLCMKIQNSIRKLAEKKGNSKLKIKTFCIPPMLLDIFWNRLHILPIEYFIGEVDIFITSDWTEPPARKARKITILYDLIIKRYPRETDNKIVQVQTRRLNWVKKESDIIICISDSTKSDAMEILGIEEKRLRVIYPGI